MSSILPKKLQSRIVQKCPLCGEKHIVFMRGIIRNMFDNDIVEFGDRGYSFCNCRNIFYTNWKNIDIKAYKQRFKDKLASVIITNEIKNVLTIVANKYPKVKSFYNIFDMDSRVKRVASDNGFDIRKAKKYDFIFASYYFNRVKDVSKAIQKCRKLLKSGGLMYIAMPNNLYINFEGGNTADYDWFVTENHTLWNKDDFEEVLVENGFTIEESKNGLDYYKTEGNKWLWRKDFQIIAKRR